MTIEFGRREFLFVAIGGRSLSIGRGGLWREPGDGWFWSRRFSDGTGRIAEFGPVEIVFGLSDFRS